MSATIDFGYDQIPSDFTGKISSINVEGPGALLGEMSGSGVVPPGPPISGAVERNYSF